MHKLHSRIIIHNNYYTYTTVTNLQLLLQTTLFSSMWICEKIDNRDGLGYLLLLITFTLALKSQSLVFIYTFIIHKLVWFQQAMYLVCIFHKLILVLSSFHGRQTTIKTLQYIEHIHYWEPFEFVNLSPNYSIHMIDIIFYPFHVF